MASARIFTTRLLSNFSILQCKNHVKVCNISKTYLTSHIQKKTLFTRSRQPLILRLGIRTEVTEANASDTAPVQEKGEKAKAKKKPKTVEITPVDFRRLDIRVGQIINVKKHPDADTLYVEEVDIGDPKPRTVVSGLVNYVAIEELENKMVVLLCNVKPAKMRGVESQAMLLCANTTEKVEVLSPPEGSVPGDRVIVEGYERTPDWALKKKILDSVLVDLNTNDSKVATYKGAPLTVQGKGVVTVPSLAGVSIK